MKQTQKSNGADRLIETGKKIGLGLHTLVVFKGPLCYKYFRSGSNVTVILHNHFFAKETLIEENGRKQNS